MERVRSDRHAHGLLARGREALEELFPGLSADLVERGVIRADPMAAACEWPTVPIG